MPWDSLAGTWPEDDPRLSVEDALRSEFTGVVAVDANLKRGTAFLAVRCDDNEVRPTFLLIDRDGFIWAGESDGPIMVKEVGIEDSPGTWPSRVVRALTTWEWPQLPRNTTTDDPLRVLRDTTFDDTGPASAPRDCPP